MSQGRSYSDLQKCKELLVEFFTCAYEESWSRLVEVASKIAASENEGSAARECEIDSVKTDSIFLPKVIRDVLVSCRDGQQWNVLHFAAAGENISVMKKILAMDPNLAKARDSKEGLTPLMVSARHGKVAACRLLAEAISGCIHDLSNDGKTVLHFSVQANSVACVEYFLRCNVDVTVKANSVGSATYWCAINAAKAYNIENDADRNFQELELLEILLKHNPTALQAAHGFPPILCVAAGLGNLFLVELLLKYGVPLDNCDEDGSSALHMAVDYDHFNIVQILALEMKRRKPEALHLLKDGKTALDIAIEKNQTCMITILVACGGIVTPCPKQVIDNVDSNCNGVPTTKVTCNYDHTREPLSNSEGTGEEDSVDWDSQGTLQQREKIEKMREEGINLMEEQNFDRAVFIFREAYNLGTSPKTSRKLRGKLKIDLGSALQKLGDLEGALRATKKATRLHPTSLRAYLQLAEIYTLLEQYEEGAIAKWEAVCRASKDDALCDALRASFVKLVERAREEHTKKNEISSAPKSH